MSQYNRGGHGAGRPRSTRPGYTGERNPSRGDKVANHWPDYLKGGYFDEQGHLKIEFVTREKVEPLAKAMCEDRSGLTTHQIRRYFGHCRAIETRLKSAGTPWASVWPEVKKLDIAAADGAGKQPPKIPSLFHDFIRRNVDQIKTKDDFLRGFLPHFEALLGFGQAHFRKERT